MSSTTPSPSPTPRNEDWVVRMNRRNRSASFVMLFAVLGSHLVERDAPALVWGLLILQFFAYPQLIYLRALRAPQPQKAEIGNLLLDAALFGLWSAALAFPLWITFVLFICALINISFFRGPQGMARATAAFLAGAALGGVTLGWRVEPSTSDATTLLAVVGFGLYLILTANISYERNRKLHAARAKLEQGELALHAANQSLQAQLDEIRALQGRLQELANRDSLTGLYNRRYFDSTLERELARCKREGLPLCLILIDIDHFKEINDTYGHPAGDEVLKYLAAVLGEQAREGDVACRYGGEEFLLLLPGMPLITARERAEQWCRAFAQTTIAFGELRIRGTVSIGIATYPAHGKSPQELLQRADLALYQAKAAGRNRVAVFGASAPA